MGEDLACGIWSKLKVAHGGDSHVKVEAIMESSNYETLSVDELFSKLKSSEVDRKLNTKATSLTDPHSLALVCGSAYRHANPSVRHFALSSLVSLPDEEFEVLSEEDLALLTRRFGRMYENRKGSRRSGSTCYRCGKMGHFSAECPEEAKIEYKHRPKEEHKHYSKNDYHRKHKPKK